MKKYLAASLMAVGPLAALAACSDSTQDNPPGTTSAGGSAGANGGGAAGSGGSSAGASGTAGKSGAGGTAGSAGQGGQGGSVDGGSGGSGGSAGSGGNDGGADVTIEREPPDDGLFPPNAVIGSCDPLNWITSASNSAAGNPPANAVDGLLGTRWSTGVGQAPGVYYQIDFGGFVQLSQINLNNTGSAGDHPRGYDVETSRGGVDFSNVIASGTQTDVAPPGNIVSVNFQPRAVRYLRIQLTAASGSWWSVNDLTLGCQIPVGDGGFATDFPPNDTLCGPGAPPRPDGGTDASSTGDGGGTDAGGADTNVVADPFDRTRWTLTASSTNAGDAITNAIDGNIATRWSSGRAQTPTDFFKIDLGSVGCVGQVRVVSSGGDFATAYTVGVSTDDVSYITVAKGAGSPLLQLVFRPRFARYVRINQVGASAAWWSIDEITVTP